jgi:flagellar biosynthetic protein FlhB
MSEQRTEKATPQRLRKAREKGQFPTAKEFVSAAQFFVIAMLIVSMMPDWWEQAKLGFGRMLKAAFQHDLTTAENLFLIQRSIAGAFLPLAAPAGLLLAVTVALQLGATNMGFSLAKLAPNFSRMNPMGRLKEIGRQNFPAALQALFVLLVVGWSVYGIERDELDTFMTLPLASAEAGIAVSAAAAKRVLWRATGILFVIGAVEMFRQRRLYNKDLSMTKQEVKEEMKEQEGDPHLKAKIRRMRRDLLRRRMMQEVPTASVVIVNPTHYAIAIRYDSGTMASPKVVAKGRNLIAARIKALASENDVPIVENPPLARALYKSVEVGRDIPPDFFRAVAEVLAYVYRLTGRRPV